MKDKIIENLKSLKPILKEKFGIEKLAVFGSVAKGDDNEKSDIDLVIIKANKKNYFDLLEAKYFLRNYLKKEVDIGYFDSIRNVIKKEIEKDLIYV